MLTRLFPDARRDVAFPLAGAILLFTLIVGTGLLYQAIGSGSAERLVTAMLIDAIIVVGIQIYIGNTGVLSFGHIGFGAIAGYVFAVFAIDPERKQQFIADAPFGLADVDVSPVTAGVAAVVVTLVVAVVVGLGLARSGAQSGAVSATVITLALLFVTHEVASGWTDVTGGERAGLAFSIAGTLKSRLPIYITLLAAIVTARLFAQSRTGRLAAAAREDNLAARAIGVNPMVQQMAALLISVAVVSVGSSLRVFEIGTILPGTFFFSYTLVTLVMLIVGGRNSVTGAILGTIVMTAGRELTRQLGGSGAAPFGIDLDANPLDLLFREGLPTVFLGLAMVGFMVVRPSGILDDWELDDWLRRRLSGGDAHARPEPLHERAVDPEYGSDGSGDLAEAELRVDGVDVRFGGFQALTRAGLRAGSGEVVGIIGPNGAGKTTLVNVITGVVQPSAGTVTFSLGASTEDLTGRAPYDRARTGLLRTFQNLRLFGAMTVRENVEAAALVAGEHRADRLAVHPVTVDTLVAEAGLWDHRDRRASELDYGNSRRLELARAAAMAPVFMLLDEPTSGMSDTESGAMIEQVRHMAATVGAGVIVIDHDLNFITGISDRIYVLDQGRVIAEGTPAEVQANRSVQEAYLGSAAGSDAAREPADVSTADED